MKQTQKTKAMLQRSQIGAYKSKKTLTETKLNRIFVTPNNNEYSLVNIEKMGSKTIYTYEWVNCPDSIKEVVSNRIQSKTTLGAVEIMKWIRDLKSIKF